MTRIHERLLQDCLVVGRFPLCHLLLMRDANYPWFILVPDREDITEIYQLDDTDQMQLTRESAMLAMVLDEQFHADKINIAALGNLVTQLHVHHVVRYESDVAWPAPVWGAVPAIPYTQETLAGVIDTLRKGSLQGLQYLVDHAGRELSAS
ncbi:MAG: HIT domain-containing protein [Gammaproteobacteria bacterium]|nr:MAG: HIT domain-containing protein [Gammaproteobacteria bacterium]